MTRRTPAIVALALLVASSARAEPSAVVLWHSYTGAERAGLEAALDAFRRTEPPFAVESSFVPHDALADKLSAAIPHGHGPDLFIFAHDRTGGWAEGGLVEPIELLVDEELVDRHLTPCVFALAYGESLYGLPLAFKALALFVRTDLVPEPPTTFDELLAIAKAATDRARGRYGLVYPNADLFFHSPLIGSFGGQIYGPSSPTAPDVTGDGIVRSLDLAHRLAAVEAVLPDDPSPVMVGALLSDGRAPLAISGPWLRSQIDEGVPYTVVPLPAFPEGEASAGFSTCEGVLMSRRSARKKEAFELMRFLSSDLESARLRMVVGRQTVSLVGAWSTVLEELPDAERRIFLAFRRAFDVSRPSPSHPSMNAVWTPMNAALYKVIHKAMDPKKAALEAQERIDQALRKVPPS